MRFIKWIRQSEWAAALAGALTAGLFWTAAGCTTLRQVGVPVVVCSVLSSEPGSAPYFRALSTALDRFALSETVTPTELMAALVQVPAQGIKPAEAYVLYSIFVGAYSEWYDPAKVEKARAYVRELAGSVSLSVRQCAPEVPPTEGAASVRENAVSRGALDRLSRILATDVRSRRR
jgi:hypothetical protein